MESRVYRFNQSELRVVFGSILESHAEVIVSSDDCYLSQGGGVSRAIAQAAGKGMLQDRRKMIPAQLGDVVVTNAGLLPQKYIFHCITISDDSFQLSADLLVSGHDLKDSSAPFSSKDDYYRFVVGRAMDKCFRVMNVLDVSSIAFPCIGAGVAGIPIEKVAEIMADRISANMLRTSKKYQIELYLYDRFEDMDSVDYISVFEKYAVASAITEMKIRQEMDTFVEDRIVGGVETAPVPGVERMSHHAFISYSRHDSEAASRVLSILEANGIS